MDNKENSEKKSEDVFDFNEYQPYKPGNAVEDIKKNLLLRPWFSLRMQLFLGFLLSFALAALLAAIFINDIYTVEQKIDGLEIVNDYVIAIDQARRFEKNYFLYSTNLKDAINSIYKAKLILEDNKNELWTILGKNNYKIILKNVLQYENNLSHLLALEKNKKSNSYEHEKDKSEKILREHGQKMLYLAQDLMKKEKKSMQETISRSRTIQIYSLILLLIFMLVTAYLLAVRMLRNIGRFESYMLRIAEGNFNPITPLGRYRDEFSNLAVSLNHMVQELEKHEAMLIQSHKMRAVGTLTAGIAHELNNPLNNITLTAHMFLEDYVQTNDEDKIEMIEDITRESDRGKKIIANLLDFTRESKTMLDNINLEQLVKDTVYLSANQIKIAGIKIETYFTDSLPHILGDSQQLRQVFLNLILNAIGASSKGDKIQILVHPADKPNHLSVKVIDYGKGIPKHILSRIFDPFFTMKEKGKGTGLGLSVSQGIVAKHHGRILVDSQEGKGSTFTVVLPVTTIA